MSGLRMLRVLGGAWRGTKRRTLQLGGVLGWLGLGPSLAFALVLLSACAGLPELRADLPSEAGPDAEAAWAGLSVPARAASAASGAAEAASAPAPESETVVPAVAYVLQIDAPSDLVNLLSTHLDLARFQNAPLTDGITRQELTRLANAAPAQARTLLETEGFFSAEVHVEMAAGDDGVAQVITLQVTPGPRAVVKSVTIEAEGELAQRAAAGDVPAQRLLARIRNEWQLPVGQGFRQSGWGAAKTAIVAKLRAEGYPTAVWGEGQTAAQIDVIKHEVALSGTLVSGPLFLLGPVNVEGLRHYDEAAVRNVAGFGLGTPYSEKLLLDYQERLLKLNLFESVVVEMDADPAQASAAAVKVRVRELSLQQAITGVGFSDNTGARVTLEHRHRRPFGWNGQVFNKLELGSKLRSWEGELISDPGNTRYRKLLAGSVSWLEAAGDISLSSRVRAGRSFDTERIERLIFAELLRTELTPAPVDAQGQTRASTQRQDSQAVSGNYHWVWRDLDSVLLPTKGLTTSIQAGAGQAHSNFASNGPFGRLYVRNTLYWPLGNHWYTQTRVEMGQVFMDSGVGVPDALLFRAGGDDSVRGYAYRTLGPQKDGSLASGRSLFTASAEIARPFTLRQPNLWWAAFVDAGQATDDWNDLTLALGYGLGLRIRSPVGPLRIDVAYGEAVHKTRLHVSIGIAF